MVVEGDREVEQEKQEEEEMVDNDEVEQRKESQPLIVRDTVVEVLLAKFFRLQKYFVGNLTEKVSTDR